MPKRSWTEFRSKVVFRTILGGVHHDVLAQFFQIFSHLGHQDGPELEAKTEPKSTKNRFEKRWKFKDVLEPTKFETSSNLEANMEASWHQNRSRNRCYLRKAVFWKKIGFPEKNKVFWDPVSRSWEQNSIKNRCSKQCGNRKARKLNFDQFLFDLGTILALQNGAKTLKNRCWNGIKIWSIF